MDRIMVPFRKRGMALESVEYKRQSDFIAFCLVEFDEEPENASRILKNLQRTVDVQDIEILN
ncbi:MAG TPA: hypothetical protein VD908_21375 [Cytophagales bacterium]|nr:hypothetical protein [Cytophagales bacterium]